MPIKSVGFRLGTDGKAEVKNDFAEVKKAGQDAMAGVAEAAETAAERSAQATDAYTDRQIASFQKQANAAKLAAAGIAARSTFDDALAAPGNRGQFATVNLDRSSGAARGSASVFEEQFAAEEAASKSAAEAEALAAKAEADRATTVAKLRAAIDPLSAAQLRYNDEIASYDDLLTRGELKEAEHSAAVAMSAARLSDARRALQGHTTALGLNHTQTQIATHMVRSFGEQWLYGGSIVNAASAQVGHMTTLLSLDDGGMAGGLKKVLGLLTPTTIAVGAAAAAGAIGVAAWYDYSSSLAKLDAAARGAGAVLGLTGEQMEANAEAASHASGITVGAAREIESGYLRVAASGDVLAGLTAITRDYAAATGEDMAGAQSELAAAFADPIAGAQTLTEKYGLLTQAQADHIAQLVQEGQQERAQRELLDDIAHAFGGAAEQADGLAGSWDRIKASADRAWTSAGRFFNTYGKGILDGAAAAFLLPTIDELAGPAPAARSGGSGGTRNAAANQARARAAALAGNYEGDSRAALQRTIGTLQAGINAGGTPAQIREWTSALDANRRAVETWVPSQQKANDVAAAQAKLAAARGPAAKARAERALALAQAQGEVATSADIQARANSRADAAAAHAGHSSDAHAKSLAREAESMEVAARGSLDVAAAYLRSSAAGLEAEAQRKAATDATRKGIDVEAQARRQLNLQVAEAVATGAKSVAGMRDETDARAAILTQVGAGTLSVNDMSRALSDEASLRPLIALRTVAQGDALVSLNKVIAEYRGALDAAHQSEDRIGFEKTMQDSIDRIEEFKASVTDLSHTPLDAALNAANRAAGREADAAHLPLGSADRLTFVRSRENEAQAKYDADRAKFVHDTLADQRDGLVVSQRELELAGANDNHRTVELDQLHLALTIRRQFPNMAAADVGQLMAGVAAQDAMNARLKVTAAAWDEVHQFGDQFVDDVLSPDTWSSWGNAGKTILKDIENEFIKLAVLNPLKNLLGGGSALPTIGSLLGALTGGSNFALKSSITAANIAPLNLGHNATGTQHWSGGMTYVNENGPEIADLPGGTRIYPAALSREMVANDNRSRGDTHIHVYADGAVLADTVRDWVAQGVGIASARGAAGGALLGEAESSAKSARKLGRFR